MENKLKSEIISIDQLKPHPRNYREHPEDQLLHIEESIKRHGVYRNVVVAKDNTILAGHGVVLGCKKLGIAEIPIIRLDINSDDPEAMKVLTGDNEISKLGMIDDRMLTEILKDIKDFDVIGLLGTGFDEKMLANLLMVTRPAGEIADSNAAVAWVGMPEYDEGNPNPKITVHFDTDAERDSFIETLKIKHARKSGNVWSMWWPDRERDDPASVKFESTNAS